MHIKININRNVWKRVLSFLLLLLIIPQIAAALDFRDFTYRHLSMQNGISSQRIFSIRQTPDGIVWWTTKCGVDRTNGANVLCYSLDDNSQDEQYSSYAGRVIKFAHKDGSVLGYDEIYVFDNVGKLFKYNNVQNRFDYVCNIGKILGREIVLKDVFLTDDGFLVAMREGVYRLSLSESRTQSKADYVLTPITEDIYANELELYKSGELVVCAKEGVYVMPLSVKAKTKLKKISPCNSESAYYDTETKLLWIGTYNSSVKVLDPENGAKVVADYSSVIHNNPIRKIVPFDKNSMLIGIDGYGVYCADRQDPVSHTPTHLFDACDGMNGVLRGNGVYDILVDNWQNLFIGTYSGGIDIARPVGCTIARFRHVGGCSQSLVNDHVNTVMEISPDNLLMGTDDGLSNFDVASGTWRHMAKGLVVLDVCKSPSGNLLIATYGNGVCEIGADGTARPLFTEENGKLHDNHVFSILYDKGSNLWIGSLFGELAVCTSAGMKYYDVTGVNSLTLLDDGRIAVGTTHGLYIVNDRKGTVDLIDYRIEDENEANRFVLDVLETADKRLWIATDGGGVYVCCQKSGKYVPELQLTTDQGLPSNNVDNIAEDSSGRLWFGTERGLAFTQPNNPTNVANVNYGYGLQTEYVRGGVTNLKNGYMLYGTVYGAQVVDPIHIQRLNYTAKLHIRGVRVSESENGFEQYRPNELFNQQVSRMLQKNELKLKYSQRSFEIFFEGINQRHYYDVVYQYRVGDTQWSQPSEGGVVRFENLEAGKHILYIRCVSKACGTVLDTREINIFISQPWWNSWWMWIIYIVMLVLAFYGVWRVYDLHTKYMALALKAVETSDAENVVAPSASQETDVVKKEIVEAGESVAEEDAPSEEEVERDNESSIFVETATNIVLENISDIDFNIDTLCRKMAMSRTLFYVKLKTYTGKSPQDFIRVIRLEKAATLLRKGCSVTDVSQMVGFDNPKYFSTVFKKYFDISPSKYK